VAKQLGATDVTLLPGISVALPPVNGSYSMSRTTSGNLKGSSKPALKSALRVSTMPLVPSMVAVSEEPDDRADALAETQMTAAQLRTMQISEFEDWLRGQTNRDKRPFQGETLRAYVETARARAGGLEGMWFPRWCRCPG
jgi:hypothetical protein